MSSASVAAGENTPHLHMFRLQVALLYGPASVSSCSRTLGASRVLTSKMNDTYIKYIYYYYLSRHAPERP